MSDAELTELCALAMGWKHLGAIGVTLPPEIKYPSEADERFKGKLWCLSGGNDWWLDPGGHNVCGLCSQIPDPLHDDAQAMALVKRFRLQIDPHDEQWNVAAVGKAASLREGLNRAIVECVAKMQQSTVNV